MLSSTKHEREVLKTGKAEIMILYESGPSIKKKP